MVLIGWMYVMMDYCWVVNQIDNISEDDIRKMSIPNGKPMVYRFDSEMNVIGERDEIGWR